LYIDRLQRSNTVEVESNTEILSDHRVSGQRVSKTVKQAAIICGFGFHCPLRFGFVNRCDINGWEFNGWDLHGWELNRCDINGWELNGCDINVWDIDNHWRSKVACNASPIRKLRHTFLTHGRHS
jgi:hypothetical protein